MRKPAFCICENKDADQLRGDREAYQRLCFRYTDSTISLLPKYEISSLQPSSVAVQPGLCRTWSETPKTGFLTTRLICSPRPWCCRYHGFFVLHGLGGFKLHHYHAAYVLAMSPHAHHMILFLDSGRIVCCKRPSLTSLPNIKRFGIRFVASLGVARYAPARHPKLRPQSF